HAAARQHLDPRARAPASVRVDLPDVSADVAVPVARLAHRRAVLSRRADSDREGGTVMLSIIFFSIIGLSVLIALAARLGTSKNMSISEYLVGGRSFPAWLLYFLAVGEIYSIGTMIGLPSGVYAHGARDAIWFLGYILLAYPLGYYGGPLIWRAGVRYNAMTIPDVFGSHFR